MYGNIVASVMKVRIFDYLDILIALKTLSASSLQAHLGYNSRLLSNMTLKMTSALDELY